MARELKTLVTGMTYTECPRWHDGRLWFADFYTHRVLSVAEDGSDQRVEATVPQQPSGIGWLPDGRLLVVSMRDAKIFRRESDGTLSTHADCSDFVGGILNDMVVDGSGRAYAGNFGFDLMGGAAMAPADLLRIDPDGTVSVAARDLWFPNGSMLTPDERTLLVCESFGNCITAFDVAADGTLSNRRTWAAFGELLEGPRTMEEVEEKFAAFPDGATLDAEGCVWAADAKNGRLVRVREGGEIAEQIEVGSGCFACMLGGHDGKTLYVCVAPDFLEHNRKDVFEATMMAVKVDVGHAGLP